MGYFPGEVPAPVSENTDRYIKSLERIREKEKIEYLKKWDPILDALKVEDEKIRLFMAEYAECHTHREVQNTVSISQSNNVMTTLPVSLMTLSLLNLKGKNLHIVNDINETGTETIAFNFPITEGMETMNIEQIAENALMHNLADHLNKELETKDDFYVYMMVISLSLIADGRSAPKMYLMSRCKVK